MLPHRLTHGEVARFARVALAGITREYPNKPGHVLDGPDDVASPRALHPAFYGCFDWHSAVHGHWTLVRLLALYPDWTDGRDEVVAAVDGNLTAGNLAAEAAYFERPHAGAFERTYGWAWLLRLAQELRGSQDEHLLRWQGNLAPLELAILERVRAYLPKLHLPIRSGQHVDSAFALSFFLDYALAVEDDELAHLCGERAQTWYADDHDYPLRYEPSGHDFVSPGLSVADLMRRALPREEYVAWLEAYLPTLATGDLGPWTQPATVEDITDGHLVHLAGLNLTRAWMMRAVASVLPTEHAGRAHLERIATEHARSGLGQVFSGDYAGEHWLASFAVYMLTSAGLDA